MTIVCDVAEVRDPDMALLEALARVALVARRSQIDVELRGACPFLLELIALAGLDDVLVDGDARSGVEVRRQIEQREQRVGVEEEVEADDLPVVDLDDL
ncbi:MAG: STAS domain-containing protein [Acidimicrobiales bacterium]